LATGFFVLLFSNSLYFCQKKETMTTLELRNQVIVRINQVNDDELLQDVFKLLDINQPDSEVMRLTDNHKTAIETAINQINNGDYLTNEQANKEIDAWLRK